MCGITGFVGFDVSPFLRGMCPNRMPEEVVDFAKQGIRQSG